MLFKQRKEGKILHTRLKAAFETELRRLGHISTDESVDYPKLINKLGTDEIVAEFATGQINKAYLLVATGNTENGNFNFLKNILIMLQGIPTPTRWRTDQQNKEPSLPQVSQAA